MFWLLLFSPLAVLFLFGAVSSLFRAVRQCSRHSEPEGFRAVSEAGEVEHINHERNSHG